MMHFMQKLHRWLGLVLVLQVLIWLISGFFFAWQGHHAMSGHQYKSNPTGQVIRRAAPQLDIADIWSAYPQAHSIHLRRIGEQPQYRVTLPTQTLYLDAHTGANWHTTATQAKALALATYDGPGEPTDVIAITQSDEIFGWHGHGYRVQFQDDLNTRVYVDANTGEVLDHRNTPWLIADWAFRLHFMDYSGGRNFNHTLIYAAAFIGLWFTLSGLLLLIRNIRNGDLNPWRRPTLLELLQRRQIPIASGCGGGGTCGLCKVRMSTTTPLSDAEQKLLSSAQLQQGIRLACQQRDRGETFTPLDQTAKKHRLTLVRQQQLSPMICALHFTAEQPISYQAGQFLQFEIPTTNATILRNYSMANQPDGRNLTFLVRAMPSPKPSVPAGIGSSHLTHLKTGQQVQCMGPFGDFTATGADSAREQIYIAGGVGIAPIHALVQAEATSQRLRHLFHGARTPDELIYQQVFEGEQRLHYVPVISQQQQPHWQGLTGNVHEHVHQWLLEHPGDYDFYVCGPPVMLQATLAMLRSLQIDAARIRYDDFGI